MRLHHLDFLAGLCDLCSGKKNKMIGQQLAALSSAAFALINVVKIHHHHLPGNCTGVSRGPIEIWSEDGN